MTESQYFGVEYYDSEHHSNIEIILKDGTRVGVNSVVLSMNSPYFKRMIEEKGTKQIEMDEVDATVCRTFLKTLYTGVFGLLNKRIFRQVSKLSFTYEVAWMQRECRVYFIKVLGCNDDNNKFLLEEAIAAKDYDKNCQYLEALVQQKTQSVFDQDIQAMGLMLDDLNSLPVDHLDFFIRLANKCNRRQANNGNPNYGNYFYGELPGAYGETYGEECPSEECQSVVVHRPDIVGSFSSQAVIPRGRRGYSATLQKEYCTVLIEKVTIHLKNLKKIDNKTRFVLENLDFKSITSKFNQNNRHYQYYQSIDPFKKAASNFFESLLDLKEISNSDLRMTLRQHMRLGN